MEKEFVIITLALVAVLLIVAWFSYKKIKPTIKLGNMLSDKIDGIMETNGYARCDDGYKKNEEKVTREEVAQWILNSFGAPCTNAENDSESECHKEKVEPKLQKTTKRGSEPTKETIESLKPIHCDKKSIHTNKDLQ